MRFFRALTLAALFSNLSGNAWAYELQLRKLNDFSSLKVKVSQDQPHLWVIFQKKCSACRKQIKDLKCLEGLKTNTALLGAFSTEKDLRKEYRSFRTKLQAFYADKSVLKKFQISEPITPQTIISYKDKNYLMLGYTKCSKIKEFIESLRSEKR